MTKKLYRSRDDRMIAGVCGGLADYFNVDSSLIRLAVLFVFLFQGIGLIAYIIAWLVMSEEPVKTEYRMPDDYYIEENRSNNKNNEQNNYERPNKESETNQSERESEKEYYQKYNEKQDEQNENNNNRRKLFAVIMIIVGSIFMLDIWIPNLYWGKYWPVILIAAGILILKGDNNDR